MASIYKVFKNDFYDRIGGLKIFKEKIVLDVGCGDGDDALAIAKFAKHVNAIDVQSHVNWEKNIYNKIKFSIGDAQSLPYKNNSFDALFLKDVLHHVDNPEKALKEIRRVVKKNGLIILIEANRYNPIFYIHMTKMRGHEHLSQNTFKRIILNRFPNAKFIHFESRYIPWSTEYIYQKIILFEKYISNIKFLHQLLSYNAAIIKK